MWSETELDRGSQVRPGAGAPPATVLLVAVSVGVILLALSTSQAQAAGVTGTVQAQITAECDVSERFPEPSEPVILDASDSQGADQYKYDRNSEGGYDTDWINDSTYSFTYDQGTYTPRVAVRNTSQDTGNIDVTQCPTLEVAPNNPPTASADHSPDSPTVGETVTIDARTSTDDDGNISIYQFDFGNDGSFEIQENTTGLATRTYNTAGVKEVRIRVIDNDGAEDSVVIEFTVTENQPPDAAFTVTPSPTVIAGENTTLDASNSTDPDGSISYYLWDFDGDGTVDRNTTTAVITHQFAYTGGGFQNVGLTVIDDDGASDFTSRDIEVIAKPTVECSVSPRTIQPGGDVTVDVSGSTSADAFQYDFNGDGTYDTDQITVAVVSTSEYSETFYPEPGTYIPRVKAYNASSDTTTVKDCQSVTVQENNTAPSASFTVSPSPAVAGQSTTLDASGSSDPDGTIAYYRWDFDGDGTVDLNTTKTVINRAFPYNVTGPGFADVTLTVVDNDGAVATTSRDVEIVKSGVIAECSVTPRETDVGGEVTIDASGSTNAETYSYDIDGDGEFDTDRIRKEVISRPYEEAGTYTPRVRVYGAAGERTDTARCGEVVIGGGNDPPVPALNHLPTMPAPGETVTLNASQSVDADGRIVTYRWDLDNDGIFERNTSGPILTHRFNSTGNHTVGLLVIDDDGASARTNLLVRVRSNGLPGAVPWWILVGLMGGGAGYLACRGRDFGFHHLPKPFGGGKSDGGGLTAHATGTFETPPNGGAVTVDGLGFEPDLLVFTGTPASSTAGQTPAWTDGWTHGKAVRHADGSLTQHVVSVTTDAGKADTTGGSVRTGQVLDLLVHDDDSVAGVAGAVTSTTATGFEIDIDTSALSEGAPRGGYTIAYQAFKTPEGVEAAIGHALTPTEPGVQHVDLGVDANYLSLTATDATSAVESARIGPDSVGICHGTAVGDGTNQQVQSSTVDPGASLTGAFSAHTDRVLHLVDADDGIVTGRTRARVTALGETLELTYDETDCGVPTGNGEGGALLTFVALDAADQAPELGAIEFPAAEAGSQQSVALGRRPGLVSFTTVPATDRDADRVMTGNGLAFGWSHGTALRTADERIAQDVLQGTIDPDLVAQYGRLLTGSAGVANGVEQGAEDGTAADGGQPEDGTRVPDEHPFLPPAVATVPALDDAGATTGWDALAVTSFDERGFTLASTSVSSTGRGQPRERPLVCYTAWPLLDDAREQS